MKWMKAFISPVSFCILFITGLFVMFACLALKAPAVKASSPQVTVFSNPAPISPADRASNNAGTNPGIPASNYPSPINVSGLTGVVSKVTVTFAITSTFPDDFDILLVGPTGARSLVMSDAGGSGDHTNISYTFDQTAAATMPNDPTTVTPSGTFKPSNFLGFATPEPGGQDNFPSAGGLMSYPTDFNIFNGTNPNGTWNLYVVDDQVIDLCSLPSGWSIDVTTVPAAGDPPLDFDDDGKTDYAVVRNTGGGSGGQVTWFWTRSGSANASTQAAWGIATDFFVPQDYDGDGKTDLAVYRPGSAPNSFFFILQSSNSTLRQESLGATGDDPTVVDDYDGDGKADCAVYRGGASAGQPSFWYWRGTLNNPGGNITFLHWGQNGDFPVPGDRDGNGSADATVQRNDGTGQGVFFTRLSTGTIMPPTYYGTASDLVVPGDYDGDAKTDIAVVRASGGQLIWSWLRSSDSVSVHSIPWGLSATDFPVQGDYDGDGKVEPAVWRPNADPTMCFFFSSNSSNGATTIFEWGQNGDYPVANYNSH